MIDPQIEAFFRASLPDYDKEIFQLTATLILSAVVWIFVLPAFILPKRSTLAPHLSTVGVLVSFGYLIGFQSPYNRALARKVFLSPLFSKQECQDILAMADRAAQNNLKLYPDSIEFQELPRGWHKQRPNDAYPLTDLDVHQDPFLDDDLVQLQRLLDRRLAPIVSRVYGIPEDSIQAHNNFIVRYDAGRKVNIRRHTDAADITVNLLLGGDFEGGGTIFYERDAPQPFGHVQAPPGTMALHRALIEHEGASIHKGTRIIMVLLLKTEPKSWFASYFDLSWLSVYLKRLYFTSLSRAHEGIDESIWSNSHVRAMYRDGHLWTREFVDERSEHRIEVLVNESNADEYLSTLDRVYEENMGHKVAIWGKRRRDLDITSGLTSPRDRARD